MKNLLFILVAAITLASCKKSIEPKKEDQSSRMIAVQEKEKTLPQAKRPRNAQRISADLVNIGVLPISGSFSVGFGASSDTLTGTVTDFNGLWHDYHFNWSPPIYSTLPGGEGETNYGGVLPQKPTPFTYVTVIAHSGGTRSYFFGVSSNGGYNVAGKTISN